MLAKITEVNFVSWARQTTTREKSIDNDESLRTRTNGKRKNFETAGEYSENDKGRGMRDQPKRKNAIKLNK